MKVFMTGATGLVGSAVRHRLIARGDVVVALTRTTRASESGIQWQVGEPTRLSDWETELDGCDAVINLAGETVAQRWTQSAMTKIVSSRVGTTTALYHAIDHASRRPRVLLSASAVGFYGTDLEQTFDESNGVGSGFLARVCEQWELAASRSSALCRVACLRFGVVLARGAGALPKLTAPFRWGLGGPLGDGQQWMSWIHLDDLVSALLYCLDHDNIQGPVNIVAPEPSRNRDFASIVARRLRRPDWFGAKRFWLRLGLGRMANEMLLTGQKVNPGVLRSYRFPFAHPTLSGALQDLLP